MPVAMHHPSDPALLPEHLELCGKVHHVLWRTERHSTPCRSRWEWTSHQNVLSLHTFKKWLERRIFQIHKDKVRLTLKIGDLQIVERLNQKSTRLFIGLTRTCNEILIRELGERRGNRTVVHHDVIGDMFTDLADNTGHCVRKAQTIPAIAKIFENVLSTHKLSSPSSTSVLQETKDLSRTYSA